MFNPKRCQNMKNICLPLLLIIHISGCFAQSNKETEFNSHNDFWPYNARYVAMQEDLYKLSSEQHGIDNRLSAIEEKAVISNASLPQNNEVITHFDYSVSFTNLVIGALSLLITAIGVAFAFLAFLGYQKLSNLHEEVEEKLGKKMLENLQKSTTSAIDKAFNEKLSDLQEFRDRLDTIESDFKMQRNNKSTVGAENQVSRGATENSFDGDTQ